MCDTCTQNANKPMNPEVKGLWIEALESGKYQQTSGALERNGSFCCLGVLCTLAVEAGVIERKELKSEDGVVEGVRFGGDQPNPDDDNFSEDGWEGGTLPMSVQKWAGLTNGRGNYGYDLSGYPSDSLISDNDGNGHDFAQIAETIRNKF